MKWFPILQRRYKIKYDGKGLKVLDGKNIAFVDPPKTTLPVGTRIIGMRSFIHFANWVIVSSCTGFHDLMLYALLSFAALYVDDEIEQRASFYAGIVAESPSVRNSNRWAILTQSRTCFGE